MTALNHFLHVRHLHRCCCASSDVSFLRFISEPFFDEKEIRELKRDLDHGRCGVLRARVCVCICICLVCVCLLLVSSWSCCLSALAAASRPAPPPLHPAMVSTRL